MRQKTRERRPPPPLSYIINLILRLDSRQAFFILSFFSLFHSCIKVGNCSIIEIFRLEKIKVPVFGRFSPEMLKSEWPCRGYKTLSTVSGTLCRGYKTLSTVSGSFCGGYKGFFSSSGRLCRGYKTFPTTSRAFCSGGSVRPPLDFLTAHAG